MSRAFDSGGALHHRILEVAGGGLHVVDGGLAGRPAVLFLHGWPEDWSAFQAIMEMLSGDAYVAALDLPGIGGSELLPESNDKRTLAKHVHEAIRSLDLDNVTLVGHDVGGMIVYAYLHEYAGTLKRAVIMNTAVPGLDPWDDIKRNPHIWHFAFHSIPALPETLVTGREGAYFDFFYDAIAARPGAVAPGDRQRFRDAYASPSALSTGFDWYRAFPRDERDNLVTRGTAVDTPVLYLRGEQERGDLDRYVLGLRDAGLRNVRGGRIPSSGHFAPNEAPGEVVDALRAFMGLPG